MRVARFCFNPCFIGLPASTCSLPVPSVRRVCFNPCFIGLPASTISATTCYAEKTVVSILVLLDFLRQPPGGGGQQGENMSFNPCFIGLPASTCNIESFGTHRYRFQSLFYWTSCVNMYRVEPLRQTVIVFQSLFYWTSCVNGHVCRVPCSGRRVSILVLLDFLRQHGVNYQSNMRAASFQSLFYWTSCVNSEENPSPRRDHGVSILVLLDFLRQLRAFATLKVEDCGFNPCFIGLPASTVFEIVPVGYLFSFNPCFIGLPASTGICRGRGGAGPCFNPCFIGLPASTCQRRSPRHRAKCFNPCFIGLPASTKVLHNLFDYPNNVSILVLLDFLRQRPSFWAG